MMNWFFIVSIFGLLSCRPIDASQAAGQETLVGIVGKDFILLGADSSVSQGIALTASNLDKIAPLVEPFPNGRSALRTQQQSQQQQQSIVAAAAGDAATSDRLIGMLRAYATIQEYEAGVGCDVEFVKDEGYTVEPGLTVEAMAYYARSQLAAIRPDANVCLLIAGMMVVATPEQQNVNVPSFLSHQVQRQVQQAWRKIEETETVDSIPEDWDSPSTLFLSPHLYWLDELGSLQKIQYGAHGLGSNFCLSVLDQGYHANMSLDQATKLMRDCFQQLRTRFLVNSPQPPCIKCVDANGIRLIR